MKILIFILSLVVLIASSITLAYVFENYKRQKAYEKVLCFQILDRFGEDDKECAEYKEEWKSLQ